MKLMISKHALEQARERGVGINEIKDTIQKGSKHLQDSKEGKIISLYRHIKVIFKKINNKFFVISVMIRREENGK